MMQKIRAMLKQYPAEIHTSVEPVNDIGGNQSNADVQYYIQGPDLEQLGEIFRRHAGEDENDSGRGRSRHHAAQRQARSPPRISIGRAPPISASRCTNIEQALNTLVAGQVASTFNAGEDQYDVRVRAEEQFRTTSEGLAKMTVPSTKQDIRGPR